MSLSNLAAILILSTSLQVSANEAKSKKELNLKPVSKPPAPSDAKEVRQLPVVQKVCEVSGTLFAIRDDVDEARCTEISGRITQNMDPRKKIQEMKAVPTLTPPNRDFPDPRRNTDPLKGTPGNP